MLLEGFPEGVASALEHLQRIKRKARDRAVILYSGGTTGTTKGILLSNLNFNALALQIVATNPYVPTRGDKMLAVMPMFHGFGLGVVHPLHAGGRAAAASWCPASPLRAYAKLLKKHKPNLIAGVPTLFEALLRADKHGRRRPELPEGRVLRRRFSCPSS